MNVRELLEYLDDTDKHRTVVFFLYEDEIEYEAEGILGENVTHEGEEVYCIGIKRR